MLQSEKFAQRQREKNDRDFRKAHAEGHRTHPLVQKAAYLEVLETLRREAYEEGKGSKR